MSRTYKKFVPAEGVELNQGAASARTRRVRALGKLLDNSISIPGTSWKIGLDPLLGLIPGVGDLLGALLSGYIVLEAARANVSTVTLARMILNIGIDTVVGALPVLGDVFDAAWKSNMKNVALLERHLSLQPGAITERRAAVGATVVAFLVLVLILVAGLALGIFVARLLWNMNTR